MANAPKPTIGYLVVEADWDPVRWPASGWLPMTLKDAKSRQQASAAIRAPGEPRKVILKAETTYTLIEDGGND